jgi:beta-galactosidase
MGPVRLFRDPERWDFTLTDPESARGVGFDPAALRLDWSAYYLPPPDHASSSRRRRRFEPLDLSAVFNRALADDVDGDGRGGWNDQGGNDMSLLPLGRQELDGVPFLLGPADRGALLLDNTIVKPGGFPATVTIPVGRAYAELYLLYTCTHMLKSTGEVARLRIEYEGGGAWDQPLVIGERIADWWAVLGWQQWGQLSDHGVYEAWSGPNPVGAKVNLFYLVWENPEPKRIVRAVTVTTAGTARKPFFLLGITGANPPQDTVEP